MTLLITVIANVAIYVNNRGNKATRRRLMWLCVTAKAELLMLTAANENDNDNDND